MVDAFPVIPHGLGLSIGTAGSLDAEYLGQIKRVSDVTGCGVLLDVTNVYTNAVNHGFDPAQFLTEMPLDGVVQVHLAGGFWHEGVLADSHSHPVPGRCGTCSLCSASAPR